MSRIVTVLSKTTRNEDYAAAAPVVELDIDDVVLAVVYGGDGSSYSKTLSVIVERRDS